MPSATTVTGTFINGTARTFKSVGGRIINGLSFESGITIWYPNLRINPFHSNLACIFDFNTRSFGYINHLGEIVVSPRYLTGTDFSEGRAFVFDGDKSFLLNKHGRVLNTFDGSIMSMDEYSNSIMRVSIFETDTSDMRIDGFIDLDGEFVLPMKYRSPITVPTIYERDDYYSDGLLRIWENGKYGFIDIRGNEVFPAIYSTATCFCNGFSAVTKNECVGLINISGNFYEDVLDGKTEKLQGFSEGLAAFKINDLWGYIDNECVCTIDPMFISAGYFKNGMAPVRTKEGMGITAKDMRMIVAPVYDTIEILDDGIFKVMINGQEGFLDLHGNELLSNQTFLQEFSENN